MRQRSGLGTGATNETRSASRGKLRALLVICIGLFLGAPVLAQTNQSHFLVSNRLGREGLVEFDANHNLFRSAPFPSQGVSIDPLSGSVLITVRQDLSPGQGNNFNQILKLDGNLNLVGVFATLAPERALHHLVHNPTASTVIATNHCHPGFSGPPSAFVFDSVGNLITTINLPDSGCSTVGVAVRSDGRYLLGARVGCGIFEYGPSNDFLGPLGSSQSLVCRITGLAVQPSTGNVYASTESQGVRVLDPTGSQVLKTISSSGHGLAFDEHENLYLASTDTHTILVFSPAGNLITSFPSGGLEPFHLAFFPGPMTVAVDIDIKPGSFPNSINVGSGGTVPVAIFSTASFDATTVDPMTVTLASAPVKLKGKGTPMASFEDVNGDGLLDLVVHVRTEALQLSETETQAVLEGKTLGGTPIRGADSVRVVP